MRQYPTNYLPLLPEILEPEQVGGEPQLLLLTSFMFGDPEVQKSYYYTDTGFIAQNVYLFAASQGLAAWFHNCDKQNTIKEFKLRPEQSVLFAQSVGYPA